jgi:CRP-like cAMP-binding protein
MPSIARKLGALQNISWLPKDRLDRLSKALTLNSIEKRGIIFEEHESNAAFILIEGAARITCINRKGARTLFIMVAPGVVPRFPPSVAGISYNFRCEALTSCRIGTLELESFIEISLGMPAANFLKMAASYQGRWDLVQLRGANFMNCSMQERLAIILLELSASFGVRDGDALLLSLPVRHKDLAELVGASRPRITEHLILFERKRLISRKHGRLVVDGRRLLGFLAKLSIS